MDVTISDDERQMVENWLNNPEGYDAIRLPVQVEVTRRKVIQPAPYTGEHFAIYVTHVGQVLGETVARGEPVLKVTDIRTPTLG